jgi:hypothetical protein
VMSRHQGGVDHEIGAFETFFAVKGLFKVDFYAQFFGIAAAQVITALEPFVINIHKANGTSFQVPGQAQITDQRQRKGSTARANQTDFDIHGFTPEENERINSSKQLTFPEINTIHCVSVKNMLFLDRCER